MEIADHKTALKQIPTAQMTAFCMRENAAGLKHLAGHLALILSSGIWIAQAMPFWQIVLLLHGIALTFLFTLEHETTHQTPFASRWLNESVGHICGLVLFLPFTWFRYFHLAHHRHTNDPEKDPELANPKPDTWPKYLWHLTGYGYWKGVSLALIRNAFGRLDAPYLPDSAQPRIKFESRIMLLIYALAALSLTQTTALIWLWVLPMLLGQPFLRLYLLAEHSHCAPVANMFANTRTTLTNRAIRFIAWNMPYHAEHHAAPQVPFHQLPALHETVAPYLIETANGYQNFTRDYASRLTNTTTNFISS